MHGRLCARGVNRDYLPVGVALNDRSGRRSNKLVLEENGGSTEADHNNHLRCVRALRDCGVARRQYRSSSAGLGGSARARLRSWTAKIGRRRPMTIHALKRGLKQNRNGWAYEPQR